MAEYIEREAFLAEQRHLYCDNCARRKNDKGKFVYDIGDAPCRACGICDVLDAVEDAPAADVRPVANTCATCAYCNRDIAVGGWNGSCRYWNTHSVMFDDWCSRYRPNCGADMREPPKEET